MAVCCGCYVLSGRGLCDELNTRPGESYRMRCVVVCDLETSRMRMRRPRPALERSGTGNPAPPPTHTGCMCIYTHIYILTINQIHKLVRPLLTRSTIYRILLQCCSKTNVTQPNNTWYYLQTKYNLHHRRGNLTRCPSWPKLNFDATAETIFQNLFALRKTGPQSIRLEL
jgi:hypothetical protein